MKIRKVWIVCRDRPIYDFHTQFIDPGAIHIKKKLALKHLAECVRNEPSVPFYVIKAWRCLITK